MSNSNWEFLIFLIWERKYLFLPTRHRCHWCLSCVPFRLPRCAQPPARTSQHRCSESQKPAAGTCKTRQQVRDLKQARELLNEYESKKMNIVHTPSKPVQYDS